MAYNPMLYNPYGQPQPYSWSQPAWAYHPQAATQPVNGLVSVTGIEGARAYQLPPNSAMPLFDKDSDVLYLKTTDSAGYPTIRTFAFQPMEPIEAKVMDADYVQRSEFDELMEQVRKLSEPPRMGKAAGDGE